MYTSEMCTCEVHNIYFLHLQLLLSLSEKQDKLDIGLLLHEAIEWKTGNFSFYHYPCTGLNKVVIIRYNVILL